METLKGALEIAGPIIEFCWFLAIVSYMYYTEKDIKDLQSEVNELKGSTKC